MDLFKYYSYNPFIDSSTNYIDNIIDYKHYKKIYFDIKFFIKNVNHDIKNNFFKDDFFYLENEFKLIPTKRIITNLFIKLITLQKIKLKHLNENIQIKCSQQELEYYNKGYSGFNPNRYANQYAWIAEKIGEPFTIKKKIKKKHHYFHKTNTKNQFLRIADIKYSNILYELLIKLGNSLSGKNIFLFSKNSIVKEIIVELRKKGIGVYEIKNELHKIYYSSNYKQENIDKKIFKLLFDICKSHSKKIQEKYNLETKFIYSFCEIISEIATYYIKHLNIVKHKLRESVYKHRSKIDFPICLSSGLFGGFGLAVSDALLFNNIEIFSSEHGLTAGNSIDPDESSDENEAKTSNYLFCYNYASKRLYDSYKNTKLKTFVVGAPTNTKKIKFKLLQRFINRLRLNVRKSPIIFYVSHNLQLNTEKYYPYTKSNPIIFKDELKLLKSLSKVNKDVYFKLYPTEQYLIEKLPVIKEFIKKLKNLFLIESQEDFRYIRTLSDIIITQSSESTLEWCIGLDVPLILLNSDYYEPLRNEKVKKIFKECFFVFNYDNIGWEKKLIDFLNKPYSEIMMLWNKKLKYRKKYDNEHFLSLNKDPGKIGSNHIINYISTIK